MKKEVIETVEIEKLVHGGQGLGKLKDGRKVFVWNAIPGEKLIVRLTKSKKDFAEAITKEIITKSKYRIEPREDIYLATSPWQIIDFKAENKYKAEILQESFLREGIDIALPELVTDGKDYEYRNKIEFSFYGDDNGLHYAFYNRGSHQKQIVDQSELAIPAINKAAREFLVTLNSISKKLNIRAGDLKSVIFRANQNDEVVAALFVKSQKFPKLELGNSISGVKIFHFNPKSPASVATKLIQEIGDCSLSDNLFGVDLNYDVIGFFQVNIPVFIIALKSIHDFCLNDNNIIDYYSGVGSIGLTIENVSMLIELDKANIEMAKKNALGRKVKVIHASSESALDYIDPTSTLIVDPPRSGLHKDLISKINEIKPNKICYLSCNPATQARDVSLLKDNYDISLVHGYNFFPRTPHIESLVLLKSKNK